MKVIIIVLSLLLLSMSGYSQTVIPIDTVGTQTTYKKNKIKIDDCGDKYTEKTFYINVPNDVEFKYYKHNVAEKIHGLIFTNGSINFVIQIDRKNHKNKGSWSGSYEKLKLQGVPQKFVCIEDIKIEDSLYCGYYYYKNYFVYYYNVSQDNMEQFNTAIKSIRRKNSPR